MEDETLKLIKDAFRKYLMMGGGVAEGSIIFSFYNNLEKLSGEIPIEFRITISLPSRYRSHFDMNQNDVQERLFEQIQNILVGRSIRLAIDPFPE